MIFQSDIAALDTELSQLQTLLNTKRQQRLRFEELDAEVNVIIEAVTLLKTKIEAVSPDAIASFKLAVLTLFESGDNGNNNVNQPIEPTPKPNASPLELLHFDDITDGYCYLIKGDKDDDQLPVDDPTGDEWILPSDTPLTGQTCVIEPNIYWEVTPPDGSSWELASPLTCDAWEDAPLTGQHCAVPSFSGNLSRM